MSRSIGEEPGISKNGLWRVKLKSHGISLRERTFSKHKECYRHGVRDHRALENTTAMQSATTSGTEKLRQQIYLREEVGRDLNVVRAHFLFEDCLVADGAEDTDQLRRNTFMPTMPTATDSGLISVSRPHPIRLWSSLLSLALNAINTSEREATYKADLVACWASMCHIEYAYDKHDSFAVALRKVTAALPRRGVKIYNFLVNTDSGETDLRFLDYSAARRTMFTRVVNGPR